MENIFTKLSRFLVKNEKRFFLIHCCDIVVFPALSKILVKLICCIALGSGSSDY